MSTRAPVMVWFRGDLRLADQAALHAAIETDRPVLPLYVLDDEAAGAWAPGGAARWWLHASLASLGNALKARGAPLTLRRGRAAEIIPRLVEQTGAEEVHAGRMPEPWARQVEAELDAALGARLHARLRLHRTATLFDPDSIHTGSGGTYGVYGPFARACRARDELGDPLPAPGRIRAAKSPGSDRLEDWALLPTRPDWAGGIRAAWTPGEDTAHARLDAFVEESLHRYKTGRNLPGTDGTSRLSPHLHWGELSAREVWHRAGALPPGEGRDTFLGEILWREFAAYLLHHNPHLPDRPLRPAFARLPFRTARRELRAWQRGRTGYPIVDAGMRQLWQTGWMHNRVRMIVGSFLVKQLLIDWRAGERWFWDTLVDADLANNAAGWQWIAGCGIDSQPFFRVFNPVTQGKTWDPEGAYVRRFVPELAKLPDRFLHAPWTASSKVLLEAGVKLGHDYPRPLVDLAETRRRALDTYRSTVREAKA